MAPQPQYPHVSQTHNALPALSPLRRRHVAQPPTLLTTSLSNAHSLGHGLGLNGGQTPVSTTSLSSPFSQQNHSPYLSSPAAATPSMLTSSPAAYAAAYNPQQWGRIPGDRVGDVASSSTLSPLHARQSSRNISYAPRLQGPDGNAESASCKILELTHEIEPMVSPPPPYTADPTNPSPADTVSPATDFSRGTTPSSASTPFSPYVPSTSAEHWSANPAYARSESPSLTQTAFPPPPATTNRARSSSRNQTERIIAAMNLRSRNSAVSPNATDTLQHNTVQVLERTGQMYIEPVSPPAARRAVSAGAVGSNYLVRTVYDSPVQTERVFALPPPPPGPPPATARSQSMNRVSETASNSSSFVPPMRTRQPPGRGTGLDPVPPTPANWVDDDIGTTTISSQNAQASWPTQRTWSQGESHLSGENATQSVPVDGQANTEAASTGSSSTHPRRDSAGLFRSPAVRNRSKGIRERRSESIQGRCQDSGDSVAHVAVNEALSRPLQDIVVSGKNESLAGRRLSARLTPKSGQFRGLDEALKSTDSEPYSGKLISPHSTPRSATFRSDSLQDAAAHQSSSSPGRGAFVRSMHGPSSSTLSSKPLPTLPRQSSSHGISSSSLTTPHTEDSRPLSHILHLPNDDNVNIRVMPLSPESTQSLMDLEEFDDRKSFAQRAAERHKTFLKKESQALNDAERLHLFVEHMIAESRIRRERYAQVFEAEKLEPIDLLDGMFEEPEHQDVEAHLAELSKQASIDGSRPSSATSFADSQSHRTSRRASTTTSTEPPVILTIDTSVNDLRRKDYVPVLSPIASSAVTGRDETESRGRAPSRWWESQSNPSTNGDGFKVLERSKRESKYMSAVLENEVSPAGATAHENTATSSQFPTYDCDEYNNSEYPPEKTRLPPNQVHVEPPPLPHPPTPMSAPFTPDPRKLDISRLITLPPPYPRHHPAVNNNHPDLADVRAAVRTLHDTSEQDQAKNAYGGRLLEKRRRADSLTKHQRSLHDQDMQFRMEHGEISQEEFDEAEASLELRLAQVAKDLAQADFDLYQSLVVTPLHKLYNERITRANAAFAALSSRLHEDSRTHSPNLPQEAGDEQPELLERLTMLKWLHEARESLHRDLFNLLSARNDRYKTIVLLPLSGPSSDQRTQHREATAFFAKDALSRRSGADAASLERWRAFQSVIESHATRGVEVQLSAFWDIAPPLQALLQRVPSDSRLLRNFEILVPRAEVDENPVYWEFPLRYLYSTLGHAESSSRQFVEAQVSLWCLVQEVREACVGAKWRAEESRLAEEGGIEGVDDEDEDEEEGGGTGRREWKWRVERQRDEEVKTGLEDLKEKVAAVEGQWVEGLGGEIGRVKTGLRAWLEESGGWDEELEEGGE